MSIAGKLYQQLNKLENGMNKILEILSTLCIAGMTISILFQVFYRFIIIKFVTLSVPFTEELARYLVVWSVYLIIAVCLKEGLHATVSVITEWLQPTPRKILYLVVQACALIFLGVAIYYSFSVIGFNLVYKSPTMQLPGIYLYTAPLVGCVFMAIQILIEMLGVCSGHVLLSGRKKEED